MDRAAASRLARRRALERGYPLAQHLAEVLELEAIEPLATSAKHIRQAIGVELAELGLIPLDPAEEAALLRQALRTEDEADHGG